MLRFKGFFTVKFNSIYIISESNLDALGIFSGGTGVLEIDRFHMNGSVRNFNLGEKVM